MSGVRSTLFIGFALLVVMQGCNRKLENTAVKDEGPAKSVAAAPPAAAPEHSPIEEIPSVQSPTQVPKPAAMMVPKQAFQDVLFDFNQATIRDEAKRILTENAKALKDHPEMKVKIEGYCDERGTDEYNLTLGNRRAEAVKRYLINLGVKPSQLSTISYGKEKSFCSEHNEACYRQNRRGHFASLTAEN